MCPQSCHRGMSLARLCNSKKLGLTRGSPFTRTSPSTAERSSRLAPSAPEVPTYGWPPACPTWHTQAVQKLSRKRGIVLNLQGGG